MLFFRTECLNSPENGTANLAFPVALVQPYEMQRHNEEKHLERQRYSRFVFTGRFLLVNQTKRKLQMRTEYWELRGLSFHLLYSKEALQQSQWRENKDSAVPVTEANPIFAVCATPLFCK